MKEKVFRRMVAFGRWPLIAPDEEKVAVAIAINQSMAILNERTEGEAENDSKQVWLCEFCLFRKKKQLN